MSGQARNYQYQKVCVFDRNLVSYFWSVFSRIWTEYGPEMTPYLGPFHAVMIRKRATMKFVNCKICVAIDDP